jgi:hypothetical protein
MFSRLIILIKVNPPITIICQNYDQVITCDKVDSVTCLQYVYHISYNLKNIIIG